MALTQAHQHIDPKTKKQIKHFGKRSQFTVYVRRNNGRKITVFMGYGDQIREVLDFYNNYKIFNNDRKYLYHRLDTQLKEQEEKVLMENGYGETRLSRNQPGRKRIDYKFGEMASIKHIPITILVSLDDFINKGYVINSQVMFKSKLIMILLSEFLELGESEKLELLARGDLLLERHKLACGGFTSERVQKEQTHLDMIEGGDLL